LLTAGRAARLGRPRRGRQAADGGPCGAFGAAEAWSPSRVDGAIVDERAARAGARPGRGQAVGGTMPDVAVAEVWSPSRVDGWCRR